MKYEIQITKAAERDLFDALNYIDYVLKNPAASDHLLEVFEKKIMFLNDFPESRALVDDPVLKAWEIRFVSINKYLLFYRIEADKVYILRLLYEKMDWISILGSGFDLE